MAAFIGGVALAFAPSLASTVAATAESTFGQCTVGACATSSTPVTQAPPSSSASTPAKHRDTTPPGRVRYLHAATNVPGRITLRWSNPGAPDLAGIVVRRALAGSCPASSSDGIQVGGTSIRASQVDATARDTVAYCYAVFAFDRRGNTSAAVLTHRVRNPGDVTPPPAVTGLSAATGGAHHVVLTWSNPARAGVTSVWVRRGAPGACPAGRAQGTGIGGTAKRRRQVDLSAAPGSSYCYRVFAVDKAGNVSRAATLASFTVPAPAPATTPPPSTHPDPAAATGRSSDWLTSALARMAAVTGLAMLLVAAAALSVVRRRTHTSAYIAARHAGPRIAISGYPPVALVIPALLIVGSCAAIALVLLNH